MKILICDTLNSKVLEELQSIGHCIDISSSQSKKQDLVSGINDAEIVVIRSSTKLTKEIIGDKVDISEIENISSKNIVSNLFHLTLIGDLVSVYIAENLDIDVYDITAIENLKKLLKG